MSQDVFSLNNNKGLLWVAILLHGCGRFLRRHLSKHFPGGGCVSSRWLSQVVVLCPSLRLLHDHS